MKRAGKTWEAEKGLTPEYLLSMFEYRDGVLYWKVDCLANKLQGKVAGTLDSFGHRIIRIGGIGFRAHRLVWIIFKGFACPSDIDHINRDPDDNRIENLRSTTNGLNRANSRYIKKSTTGYRGVHLCRRSGKYVAVIKVWGKLIYLGKYHTPEEAAKAYNAGAVAYFKEFANLNEV